MPGITLDPVDAAEIAETLTFLAQWLSGSQKQALAESFTAFVGHPSGRPSLRSSLEGPMASAADLGIKLASSLLRDGAKEILDEVRSDEIFP